VSLKAYPAADWDWSLRGSDETEGLSLEYSVFRALSGPEAIKLSMTYLLICWDLSPGNKQR
jgi:hypothetical protein